MNTNATVSNDKGMQAGASQEPLPASMKEEALPPSSDGDYIREIAKGYKSTTIKEFAEHELRLSNIARILDRAGMAPAKPVGAAWQPISTAPTDGTRIMLGIAGRTIYPHDELCHLAAWDGVNCYPYIPNAWTHWQPLPAAPVAALQDGEAL